MHGSPGPRQHAQARTGMRCLHSVATGGLNIGGFGASAGASARLGRGRHQARASTHVIAGGDGAQAEGGKEAETGDGGDCARDADA